MDWIVEFFSLIQGTVGAFAGFGVDDEFSVASFLIVVWFALFGAVCINHFSERHDNVHLAFNAVTMFAGGVLGNAALRGVQLPMGNELVLTSTLALFGMSAAALILLVTYSKTDI